MAKKKKTYAALQAEVTALRAQLPCTLGAASHQLDKVGTDRFMASAVIVSITAQNGTQLVEPFMCHDGLTKETILELQRQILHSLSVQGIIAPKQVEMREEAK